MWYTPLEIAYFNRKTGSRETYKQDFYGDAQWKQAAKVVDDIINDAGADNIYSINLDLKPCHWFPDNAQVIVPKECLCRKCRPATEVRKLESQKASSLYVLLLERKFNPGFVRILDADGNEI